MAGHTQTGTTMKKEHQVIDGTPEKRLFLSIISDYDLRTGLYELVDNALDLWTTNKRRKKLRIDITLDSQRQIITVKDNAGGVKEDQLRLLVAPGATRNTFNQEVIGIFGVGGKRAAVALGEHVEIKTRKRGSGSFQLDITNAWLGTEDWDITSYVIDDIPSGTTTVEISKLRQSFGQEDVDEVEAGLGETYRWFIEEGCEIHLNGKLIKPKTFELWAYPKGYQPQHVELDVVPVEDEVLHVEMTAGLIRDRDPISENYGVYIYCNNRLIIKELRSRDVGYFVTGEAGVPHPDASLCRVIVRFRGNAKLMPWNSSKSGVNFNHPAIAQIRPTLISLVSYYSSLSRRFKNDWDDSVFRHKRGTMQEMDPEEVLSERKVTLPALPRTRKKPYIERLKESNKRILKRMPWVLGLVEAMGLVELVSKQKVDTKNRTALILLDSNFEIGLKEFIVSRTDLFPEREYSNKKIAGMFKQRTTVINEVKKHVPLDQEQLDKVRYYYRLRNNLIHERATVEISDTQVKDYRKVTEKVLKQLFDLKWPQP